MKKRVGCVFYEYAPVFWNSGHGGGRSGEKAGFYTKNHYS